MTEKEWADSIDAKSMLRFVAGENRVGPKCEITPSARKFRLFAAACYRLVTADYIVAHAQDGAKEAENWAETGKPPVTHPNVRNLSAENNAVPSVHAESACAWIEYHGQFGFQTAALACEIFGNATNPMVLKEPYWRAPPECMTMNEDLECVGCGAKLNCLKKCPLTPKFTIFDKNWRSSTVLSVATSIYEERAFDRLPILADGLEDAGCTDVRILQHLRGVPTRGCDKDWCLGTDGRWPQCPKCGSVWDEALGSRVLRGPHALGCWVLDLVMEKQ